MQGDTCLHPLRQEASEQGTWDYPLLPVMVLCDLDACRVLSSTEAVPL